MKTISKAEIGKTSVNYRIRNEYQAMVTVKKSLVACLLTFDNKIKFWFLVYTPYAPFMQRNFHQRSSNSTLKQSILILRAAFPTAAKIRSDSSNTTLIAVLLFAVWSSESNGFESLTRIWPLRCSASFRSASNSDMIAVHQTVYKSFPLKGSGASELGQQQWLGMQVKAFKLSSQLSWTPNLPALVQS